MLSSIAAESQLFLFTIPSSGIAYVNTIFTLISISFSLVLLGLNHPYYGLLFIQIGRHCLLFPTLTDELTYRLRPYLPDNGSVAGKHRDITIDKYVEDFLKLSLWLDLHILTSVFKLLFGKLMLSKSFLTLSYSYRGRL